MKSTSEIYDMIQRCVENDAVPWQALNILEALNEQIGAINARLDKLEKNRTIGPIKDLARSKP